MNETTRTLYFVLAAVVAAAAGVVVDPSRSTPDIFDDVGEPFFEGFDDPQAPRSIEVIDYDESTATATPLKVEFQDSKWVIPSHYSYPADAAERLADTSAALMELRKDRVVSDLAQDHTDFSVVDPLDDEATSLAGRGKRVRILDSDANVLADFIVGSEVDGKFGYRYMRVPGQKRTYEVKTEADVSARFQDWIETDLLKVSPFDLRRIEINRYTINERLGRIENRQRILLTQKDNDWSFQGGEPDSDTMSGLTTALDALRIVDVQPKPESLSEDLKARTGIQPTRENFRSLQGKGFFPNPYTGQILSNEGEILVDSKDGLRYVLRFGEIAPGASSTQADGEESGGERRFVMISVTFSEDRAKTHEGDADKGRELSEELRQRFADWYYVISGADFEKLRPSRADLRKG